MVKYLSASIQFTHQKYSNEQNNLALHSSKHMWAQSYYFFFFFLSYLFSKTQNFPLFISFFFRVTSIRRCSLFACIVRIHSPRSILLLRSLRCAHAQLQMVERQRNRRSRLVWQMCIAYPRNDFFSVFLLHTNSSYVHIVFKH